MDNCQVKRSEYWFELLWTKQLNLHAVMCLLRFLAFLHTSLRWWSRLSRRRAGFRGSPLPRGFRGQSLIAVAACDSDEYTFLLIPFKSNQSLYKTTDMFTTMAKTIQTTVTTTIAASLTTGTTTSTTTTIITATTSVRGRFSGNWKIALIVMLGVLGPACVAGTVALLNTWLKRKVKRKHVSSIPGAKR